MGLAPLNRSCGATPQAWDRLSVAKPITIRAATTPDQRRNTSQHCILHAFALRQTRHAFAEDERAKVLGLLVRGERGFVLEQLIEQKLRRVRHAAVHEKELHA